MLSGPVAAREGLNEDGLRRETMSESWHNLLAAIPKEARINRRPVIAPGSLRSIDGVPVADWETLTIELSDGVTGLRHVLVTLDGSGRAISASDLVLYRRGLDDGRIEVRTESIGGRIESDGRFFGTRWTSIGYETRALEHDTGIESRPSTPSDHEVDRLLALVKDVQKRRPPRPSRAARAKGRAKER
jgi:hypothetical protein